MRGTIQLLVVLVLLLGNAAFSATLVLRSGEKLEGEVKAISERGIVFNTDNGTRTIPLDELYELKLDRPWIIALADGSKRAGRLEVRKGQWYLDSIPLNFYSIFAFAPAKESVLSEKSPSVASKKSAFSQSSTSAGSKHEATSSTSFTPPGSKEIDKNSLLSAEIKLTNGALKGELLLLTPRYLLLQSADGSFAKIPLGKVKDLSVDTPWTVVDLEGKRYTGELKSENGEWKIDGVSLDLDQVVAFVPRLDLKRSHGLESPAKTPNTSAIKIGQSSQSRVLKRESSRREQPKIKQASVPCMSPELLNEAPKVDVAGWNPDVAVKTAGDFAKSGDWAEAVRIFKQTVNYNPDAVRAWIRLGHAYRTLAAACAEQGEAERSLDYYEKAIKTFDEALSRAERVRDRKEASYWKSRVEKEKAWGPVAVEAFEKGYAAYQKKDYVSAAEFFKKAAEANPKWPDAFYWQGRALLELDRREEAIKAFQQALTADPSFKAAQERLLKLGVVAQNLSLDALLREAYQKEVAGDLAGARDLYLEATKRFPTSFKAYYRLGLISRRMGLWQETLEALNQALKLADEQNAKQVRYWLGRIQKDATYGIPAVDAFEKGYQLYAKGDYQSAAERFAEAARMAPSWADAFYWQARSLLKLGQVEDARQLLKKVLELDPSHAGANQLLRSLSY